jgi:hypothetical protein
MPKPAEEKVAEEKLEEETSKITETQDGGVEVSVEEETPKEETVVQEKKEEEKKPERKQDPLTNKVYAHDRILTNVQKSIEELKNIMLQNSPSSNITREQESQLDELDKLAQTDWKAAVGRIAEEKFKQLSTVEKQQIKEATQQQETAQLMEKNSQFVVSRHPELEDETSEKSQLYQSILKNNPRLITSPDGPLLVMYEMETELRKQGYDVDGNIKTRVEAEKERITRVTASTLPSSRVTVTGNKIVLTREQREFCDQNGISYEDYARTLKNSGGKEGVQI